MLNKIIICEKEYSIDEKITNILDVLVHIKTTSNNSLAFKYGCKSGVCGSCAVRVDGVEQLACCSSISSENTIIEPLKNLEVIRDLVVDDTNIKNKLLQSKANLEMKSSSEVSQNDVDKIDLQSNCILCNSCYSSCPVYEVNKDFIGPFALTRAYRYLEDNKESSTKSKLDAIQTNGVWDCTLCGACSLVCPASIDIKNDIMKLQNLSVQNGYKNPTFSNSSDDMFGGFDSGADFGFNPNGF